MNMQECIEYFETMRPHYDIALEALREKQERENPQPLTLEQLKERVGKPVWIWSRYHKSEWHILYDIHGDRFIRFRKENGEVGWQYSEYGENWLAYDHEPKEAQK